jgi:hypothetical protein
MPNPKSSISKGALVLLALALLAGSGCAPMWAKIRESQRVYAVDHALDYARRGDCEATLAALDRAEARLDIGRFGREATVMRMRCYEQLEKFAVARAHQRLLDDFYASENPAYPNADGTSTFRVRQLPHADFEKPPSAIRIESPRYSESARRSKIVGRVVIAFELSERDKPKTLRVLEMPHPLLASWAIEAVARSGRDRKAKGALIPPGGHYLATFAFEYRFAKGKQEKGELEESF